MQAARENTCRAERMAIINFEREQNRHALQLLDSTEHGNAYQDRTTQMGYINMMDPLVMVQGGVLQCNLSSCADHEALSRHATPETAAHMQCMQQLLQRLVTVTQQMRDIDRQYYATPALAQAKKSQLYLNVMRDGGCN